MNVKNCRPCRHSSHIGRPNSSWVCEPSHSARTAMCDRPADFQHAGACQQTHTAMGQPTRPTQPTELRTLQKPRNTSVVFHGCCVTTCTGGLSNSGWSTSLPWLFIGVFGTELQGTSPTAACQSPRFPAVNFQYSLHLPSEGWPAWVGLNGLDKHRGGTSAKDGHQSQY